MSGAAPYPAALVATARALAVDRVTGEVVAALREAGVPSLLIKGPTIATWLYDDGSARAYGDSDLWVPPDRLAEAVATLRRLGFERAPHQRAPAPGEVPHAEPWVRADGGEVDLHHTLSGIGVAPAEAWEILFPLSERMDVGGVGVDVPPLPARALLVVFHAAQHGAGVPKPLEDLRRAIERVDLAEWREIAELAARLDATPTLGAGLRLLPEGAAIADRLGVASLEVVASARGPGARAPLALGFQRLAEAPGIGARFRLVLREVFPSPAFMRWWTPLARRGLAGLALAYGWRLAWLLRHAGPSLVAWRRSRGGGADRPG